VSPTQDAPPARGRTAGRCAHCSLPLPIRPQREDANGQTLLFCCVGCVLVYRVMGREGEGGRADWFLAKLGLAALLGGNVMLFQSLSYFGTLEELGQEVVTTSSWIMFACSLAVYGLLGVPMLRVALRGLRYGRLTLETLIGFGTLAAIGFSAVQTFTGRHHLYYDSGTMVLVFVTLGQYFDAESRRRALALLSPTMAGSRRPARLYRGGEEALVAPDQVAAGEVVHVHAGEEIPVDGQVLAGTADVHEPQLTGEWRPRSVGAADTVTAGSTAIDGALLVSASGAAETLADRVARFALEARDRRAPIEAIVDQIVAKFIPAVILVSVGCGLLWGLSGDWDRGLMAALAVLVVACPCALGIATPMATTIALSRAIGHGCLVRSGAALEALSRVTVVALDKTGTLTAAQPRVRLIDLSPAGNSAGADPWRLAAAVERHVSHPFAEAIVRAVTVHGALLPPAGEVRVVAGCGAHGVVERRLVHVGKPAWLRSLGIAVPAELEGMAEGSLVVVALDHCYAGALGLEDPPRPEARAALAEIERMGLTCHLLSGDRHAEVARVAAAVGCAHFESELSPVDKPERVSRLARGGALVAMVGDGVNDAPAMGTAAVGVAFGRSADLTRETADVTILRDDLGEVPRLIALARRTFVVVRQNLAWAFCYNIVGIAVAAFGLLRPAFAAIAMVLSSVCVVWNSMRLDRSTGADRANLVATDLL